MTIQPSGVISIQDLVTEFGGTAPHSLNEYYRGGALVPTNAANNNIPTAGAISLNQFYGAHRSAIAVAHDSSPNISAYPWSGSGFGTKYADPATLLTSSGTGVAFSPDGSAIAAGHISSPFIAAYPWSGSGFGTKYTNPATLPTGLGFGVAFSPDGSAIAVAHANSPFITAYPWSGSGFGTKYANPATLPTGLGFGVAFI